MKQLAFLAMALALLLSSCTPQQKLERLIRKNPELFTEHTMEIFIKDTIYEVDTINLQAVSDSNTFEHEYGKDSSFTLDTDDFTTNVDFKRGKNEAGSPIRLIEVKTIVKPRTIYNRDTIPIEKTIKVPVPIPKPIIKKVTPNWAWWMLGFCLLVVIGAIIAYKRFWMKSVNNLFNRA